MADKMPLTDREQLEVFREAMEQLWEEIRAAFPFLLRWVVWIYRRVYRNA